MEEAELASWGRQNWSSSTASAAGPGRAHPQGQPWGQGTVTAGVHSLLEAFTAWDSAV